MGIAGVRCIEVSGVVKNDVVSVGGDEAAWKEEYNGGECMLIPIPTPCGCVVMYDMGGGESIGVRAKTVDGSDGQRVCVVVVVNVSFCGIRAASLTFCRCR